MAKTKEEKQDLQKQLEEFKAMRRIWIDRARRVDWSAAVKPRGLWVDFIDEL